MINKLKTDDKLLPNSVEIKSKQFEFYWKSLNQEKVFCSLSTAISSNEFEVARQAQYRSEVVGVFKDNRSVSMGFRQRQIKAFATKKHHLLLRHINLLVISLDQSNSNRTALESLCSSSNGWKRKTRFIGELKFFIYFSFSLLRVSNPLWQLFSSFKQIWTFSSFSMEKSFVKQSKRERKGRKKSSTDFSTFTCFNQVPCLKEYL